MIDHTKRCKNCGGTRKEHGSRKPWSCKTRLKQTHWEPWAAGEYEAAVESAKKAHAAGAS